MSTFLTTILTGACGAIVTAIIGLVIKRSVEKRLDIRDAERQELEEARAIRRREERKADVVETLTEVIKPLKEQVAKISIDLKKNIDGTVTLLRERMEQSHDRFMKKGKMSATEFANWQHLYSTYVELGGNHFREYVDTWHDDIEKLPREN